MAPMALALVLLGCSAPNSATEPSRFALFMPPGEEARIGRQEHPKILARFGGVSDELETGAYVAAIGGRLAHHSGRPDLRYTFTVLNTPTVNAFAVPGGYVYVTRGLIALANNEAELAGVLAHEIGHVVARHTAQRFSRAVVAQLGSAVLGALTGSREVGQLAQLGGELYLKSFSREQEFEADTLGVKYLLATGYEPSAQAHFLEGLIVHAELENLLAGTPGGEPEAGFLSTHPRTPERVRRAITAAGGGDSGQPRRRQEYLDRIDGLLYGDDAAQGFVRGRAFYHPVMRFTLEVPPGFRLFNTVERLIAKGPDGALVMLDDADTSVRGDVMTYLTQVWAPGLALRDVELLDINGFRAATGRGTVGSRQGAMDLRLIAIRFRPDIVLRLSLITPPRLGAALSEDLRRMTYSFRALSEAEAAALRPRRLKVLTVQPGDSLDSLAARMPFPDFRSERLRTLNRLPRGASLTPGQRLKTVVE